MSEIINFPRQQLPFSQKTKKWRKSCLDWGDSKTFFNYSPVRKSVIHKKINYDLLNGKLHMEDMEAMVELAAVDMERKDALKAPYDMDKFPKY